MSTAPGPTGPVVVGADGSETSLAAVELAAREAALRGLALRVVHAFIWPLFRVDLGPAPLGPPEGGLRHEAQRIVDEAVRRARLASPGTSVTGTVADGAPAAVLLARAQGAALLVLGSRGLGGFAGLLLGSVAGELAGHAPCPLLVARGALARPGPVVVGADESPAGARAMGHAFESATVRGVPLVALHAWRPPGSAGPGDMQPLVYDPAVQAAEAQQLVERAVRPWHDRFPEVPVTTTVVRGGPRAALIEASASAGLVVVGTRGRGGFAGMVLGSVSHAVLHHAGCPVTIVP